MMISRECKLEKEILPSRFPAIIHKNKENTLKYYKVKNKSHNPTVEC